MLLIAVSPSAAVARDHSIEKALEEVGGLLEKEAIKLHKHAVGLKLLNAAANAEYPGAGAALAAFEQSVGLLHDKRQATESSAETVREQVDGSRARSKSAKLVHSEARKTLAQLAKAGASMDAIETAAQARAAGLRAAYDDLARREGDVRAGSASTVKELFAELERRYPAWKKDIDKIEAKYGDLLTTVTTACRDRDELTVCPQRRESDVEAATGRVDSYVEAMKDIRSRYGEEVEEEIAAFVRAHPSGILADIAGASAAHNQRAVALHAKLDWFDQGLTHLSDALAAAE